MTEQSDLFSRLGVTPVAVLVGVLMMGLASLATAWNQIDSWLDRRKDKPAPSQVAAEARELYAAKSDVAKLETDFSELRSEAKRTEEKLFQKLGGVERGMRQEVKADVAGLAEKFGHLSTDVAALSAATKLQNQQLTHIEAKLDRLIERKQS